MVSKNAVYGPTPESITGDYRTEHLRGSETRCEFNAIPRAPGLTLPGSDL